MGSSKSSTNQSYNQNNSQVTDQRSNEQYSQGANGSQQTFFDPRSNDEQNILNQYQDLGTSQYNYLNNIMGSDFSPFSLGEADQSTLDKAYQSARERLLLGGKDYADYLATTRGLNKSDTPVSLQAMDRFGQSLSDLESQKANASLNLGLQGNQFRLQGAQSLPAGLGAAFMPMFNERMAGGRTQSSQNAYGQSSGNFYNSTYGNQNGTSTTTQRYTPSIMSQIGQGMGLAAGAAGMIGGAMTGNPMLIMGGGSLASGGNPLMTSMTGATSGGMGMGSGAAANSWFGPGSYALGGMVR